VVQVHVGKVIRQSLITGKLKFAKSLYCEKFFSSVIFFTFFFIRFPKQIERRVLWAKKCRLDVQVIGKFACICSNHFGGDSFITKIPAKLKKDAIPVIFDNVKLIFINIFTVTYLLYIL
jgi:hypothetical protein